MLFSDQVEVLAKWFRNWNECEQTVALYSLLKRVKKCQAKFLARCLEHFLNDCDDLQQLEEEANSHEFVSRLYNESQQSVVIETLLSHLPLLTPGNELAKERYLAILPKVLAYAVERLEFLEESRQLLSYSLIHPAFDNRERNRLTQWMAGLDNPRVQPVEISPEVSSGADSLESSTVPNGVNEWNPDSVPEETSSLADSLKGLAGRCALPSVSSPSASDTASSSSTVTEQPPDGMADVGSWLKSLRLHKYANIFASMSYDEMMELTAEKLDEEKVTKGARNKILLSIKKLQERFKQLQALENEILGGGSLKAALLELKSIIQTPIKRFQPSSSDGADNREVIEEDNIPAIYTKVMGKACTQLLVSKPDEENITLYMKLLERCVQHPAFTEVQKNRLRKWKQQVHKMYRSLPRNARPPGSQRSQQGLGYPLPRRTGGKPNFPTPLSAQTSRPPNPMTSPSRLGALGVGFSPQNVNWFANAQGAESSQVPVDPTRRAASLDPRLGHRMFVNNEEEISNDINTRLDSLCLSVAEHALADGMDGVSTL